MSSVLIDSNWYGPRNNALISGLWSHAHPEQDGLIFPIKCAPTPPISRAHQLLKSRSDRGTCLDRGSVQVVIRWDCLLALCWYGKCVADGGVDAREQSLDDLIFHPAIRTAHIPYIIHGHHGCANFLSTFVCGGGVSELDLSKFFHWSSWSALGDKRLKQTWINIRLVRHSKWREKKFFPLFFKLCCYF